jgi:hypothetical protein
MTCRKTIVWISDGARGKDYVHEDRELRTKTVHTCGICGTKTNLWAVYYGMGGYPHLRLECPHRDDGGSTELNMKHKLLQAFQDRLHGNFVDPPALTRREIEEINAEIKELKEFFKTLRGNVIELKWNEGLDK